MAKVESIIKRYSTAYKETSDKLTQLAEQARTQQEHIEAREAAQRQMAASESNIHDLVQQREELKQDFLNAQFEGNDGAKQSISTKRRKLDKEIEDEQKNIEKRQTWLSENPVNVSELDRLYQESQNCFNLFGKLEPDFRQDFEQDLFTAIRQQEDALEALEDEVRGICGPYVEVA